MDLKSYFLPFGLKPKPQEDGPRFADLYERGAASAIDITLLFLLLNPLFSYLTQHLYARADRDLLMQARDAAHFIEALHYMWAAGLVQLVALNFMLQMVVLGLFVINCQYGWRTTPGKYLFGLSIRRAGTLEEPAKWRYIVRFIMYIVGGPLFFVISFNKQHRGVHDMIAGTVVIHTRPRGWYWAQVKRGFRWVKNKFSSSPESL